MTRLSIVALLTLIQISQAFIVHSSKGNHRSSSMFQKATVNDGELNDDNNKDNDNNKDKRIVFIRHGCTYMNEYLGMPGRSFGAPNFSDVFTSPSELDKHQDAKLSALGVKQATTMAARLLLGNKKKRESTDFDPSELDLVVVSPLTRAIQTFELGLLPSLQKNDVALPKVLALPLASERVYLISDIGRPRSALEKEYDYIDFQSEFSLDRKDLVEEWWFGLDDKRRAPAISSGLRSDTYEEWRPTSQNQQYACPGEPDESFENRMRSLYRWLGDRPESTIAVVCHWGVIEWMLDQDFRNCQVEVVPYEEIQPLTMVKDGAVAAR